ncbi:MAG: hypothetical protein RLZ98_2805 [Pseudomonadota bacterium]|jgi:uncharacterized protein GlcG (DUF336 family)
MQLEVARKIVDAAMAKARQLNLKPMAFCVLDARAAIRLMVAEDGASQQRAEIAFGKTNGAIAFGMGSRGLAKRVAMVPEFMPTAALAIRGPLIAVAGAVLIKDGSGNVLGAIGASGDAADNDEACCLAGIEAAGLISQVGD